MKHIPESIFITLVLIVSYAITTAVITKDESNNNRSNNTEPSTVGPQFAETQYFEILDKDCLEREGKKRIPLGTPINVDHCVVGAEGMNRYGQQDEEVVEGL